MFFPSELCTCCIHVLWHWMLLWEVRGQPDFGPRSTLQPSCHRWFDFLCLDSRKILSLPLNLASLVFCFVDSILHVRELFLNCHLKYLFFFSVFEFSTSKMPVILWHELWHGINTWCYLLHHKLHQTQWPQTAHIYLLSVSVGQDSNRAWVPGGWGLSRPP